MEKRLCNGNFSFLPMLLVSSVKDNLNDQTSVLLGGQRLDRVMFCPRSFDFNDFSLKLTKYLMFLTAIFVLKSEIELPRKTQALHLQHQSATCFT